MKIPAVGPTPVVPDLHERGPHGNHTHAEYRQTPGNEAKTSWKPSNIRKPLIPTTYTFLKKQAKTKQNQNTPALAVQVL